MLVTRGKVSLLRMAGAYASGALVKCRKVGAANWVTNPRRRS